MKMINLSLDSIVITNKNDAIFVARTKFNKNQAKYFSLRRGEISTSLRS